MSEIDLIPRSYRDAVRARRILKGGAIALAAMLAVGTAGFTVLVWQLRTEQARLAGMRSEADRIAGLRKQIDSLSAQKSRLDDAATTLAALRGAGSLYRTAQAIDAALNRGVWLTSFRFSREPELADPSQVSAPQPKGYVLLKAAANPGTDERAWRLSNRIEIKGAALDHAALGDFIRDLSLQPGIADVRFLSSSASGEEAMQTVEFNAVAVVYSDNRAAR